jgi:hypothetical protein
MLNYLQKTAGHFAPDYLAMPQQFRMSTATALREMPRKTGMRSGLLEK